MNKGISIVMAYYNRRKQLIKTLESIDNTLYNKNNLEIIIINDNSNIDNNINDIPFFFNELNIKILNIKEENKDWINPCITYNIGFNYIKYDKVIIQNPECYHNNDILSYVDNNLGNSKYLSFGCYSLSYEESNMNNFKNIKLLDKQFSIACSSGWYNHSNYRPSYYHFCSAISYDNLKKLGGFDEDYKDGIGFDDDEFVYRIRLMNLDMKIIDDHIVFHQYHKSEKFRYNKNSSNEEKLYKNYLFNINNKVFHKKTLELQSYTIKNKIFK